MNSGGFSRDPGWQHPCWDGYRELFRRLDFAPFPTPAQLNALLPPAACSGGGAPLRFVPADAIPGVEYERHIFATGEVSTRAGNWHDLFNALAWCRWPRLKAAMNALHHRHMDPQGGGTRGAQRDGLTLLDESGALVVSSSGDLLRALARRDWGAVFGAERAAWESGTRVFVCGHAVLEKFLEPWKSITAHVLLLHLDAPPARFAAPGFAGRLDAALAARLLAGGLCDSPGDLSPLPLAGIPGWWQNAAQDAAFYADPSVFRAPRTGFLPAPVHRVEVDGAGAILEWIPQGE